MTAILVVRTLFHIAMLTTWASSLMSEASSAGSSVAASESGHVELSPVWSPGCRDGVDPNSWDQVAGSAPFGGCRLPHPLGAPGTG